MAQDLLKAWISALLHGRLDYLLFGDLISFQLLSEVTNHLKAELFFAQDHRDLNHLIFIRSFELKSRLIRLRAYDFAQERLLFVKSHLFDFCNRFFFRHDCELELELSMRVRQFNEVQSLHLFLEIDLKLWTRFELEDERFAASRAAELADYFAALNLCLDNATCATDFANASEFFV